MRASTCLAPLLAAAMVAGCGNDPETATKANGPKTLLKVSDTSKPGNWSFDTKELTARAGRITIELYNPSGLGHNVRVKTGAKCCFEPGSKDVGGTKVLGGLKADTRQKIRGTLQLKPGRYVFLCSIPGHWQQGQRGTLVVN